MKKLISVLCAAVLMIACSSATDGNLITAEGVGSLKFGMEKPTLKGYKAEFVSQYDEMDDYTEEYWVFTNGSGETAVTYHPGFRIDVQSPDFETAEGLKVGMTLDQAQKVLGMTDFKLVDPDGIYGLAFEFGGGKMAFVIPLDGMKGGVEAYNKWWASGTGPDLTVKDFEPAAKITMIMVRK